MTVQFENFEYSFLLKGRPVFRPSQRGEAIGRKIKAMVEEKVEFDSFFYHLREGGHVAALHHHRAHSNFARVDIARYFYGIGRNRVAKALAEIGAPKAGYHAKWSCVRNPYDEPRYSLPYGFVQSPALATLVLMNSAVGAFLRDAQNRVCVSVYMDDISLSSDDPGELQQCFETLLDVLTASNFTINEDKTRHPAPAIDLFNCDLTFGNSAVREDRREEFYAEAHSAASEVSFERYCESVSTGNFPSS